MNKYGLQGALKARPGKGNELADILLKASKLVSDATGCYIIWWGTIPKTATLFALPKYGNKRKPQRFTKNSRCTRIDLASHTLA